MAGLEKATIETRSVEKWFAKVNNELTLRRAEMKNMAVVDRAHVHFYQNIKVHMEGNLLQDLKGNSAFAGTIEATATPAELAQILGIDASVGLDTEKFKSYEGGVKTAIDWEAGVDVRIDPEGREVE